VIQPIHDADSESADAADKVRIEYGEGVINWRGVKMVNPGGSLALRAAISRKRFRPRFANGVAGEKLSWTVKVPFVTKTELFVTVEPCCAPLLRASQ